MYSLKEILDRHPNHYDRAKIIVTRNLALMLSVMLFLLGIINLFQNDINMYPMFGGALVAAMVLLVLSITGKHAPAAIIAIILAYLLNIYNMMVTSQFGHFVDFFWIAIIGIFCFFTLGKIFGLINLFVNIYTVSLIFHLDRVGIIERYPKELTGFSQINFIINITIAGIVFSYFFLLMLNELKQAESEFVKANLQLKLINEEKTVMLKEIHHRVKNNLQVVMSLLRLQSNEIKDQQTRHHLAESVHRISAMALIHEKMYQSETLSKIDLKGYLNSLAEDLITSYADKTKIEVDIESELDRIEPKSIVPVALIFNELVSNSIKHGFKNLEIGKILIHVTRNPDGSIQLDYSDNGEWANPEKSNGFGLEMIEIFTEQLDGKVVRKIDHGTHYSFNFPAIL
jgi:two-component sensor histidine kinase